MDKIQIRIFWTAGVSAAVIALASPWLAPHVADQANQGWVGLIGLYLTLLGLALAGHQLWLAKEQLSKVRSATEAVKVSSAALINQVQSSTRMFEASEVRREISILKTNVHHKKTDAALQSLDTVKNRLVFLKEVTRGSALVTTEIDDQLLTLDKVEQRILAAQSNGTDLRDSVKLVLEIGKIESVAMSHAAKFALTSRTESHV